MAIFLAETDKTRLPVSSSNIFNIDDASAHLINGKEHKPIKCVPPEKRDFLTKSYCKTQLKSHRLCRAEEHCAILRIQKLEDNVEDAKEEIIETKQNSDSFIVSSPSSTCETNGSRFIIEYKNELLYDNLSYCLFTVLEGSIKIQNNISEDIMYLKSGKTIVSTKNGKFLQLDTFKSSTEIQKTLLEGK